MVSGAAGRANEVPKAPGQPLVAPPRSRLTTESPLNRKKEFNLKDPFCRKLDLDAQSDDAMDPDFNPDDELD